MSMGSRVVVKALLEILDERGIKPDVTCLALAIAGDFLQVVALLYDATSVSWDVRTRQESELLEAVACFVVLQAKEGQFYGNLLSLVIKHGDFPVHSPLVLEFLRRYQSAPVAAAIAETLAEMHAERQELLCLMEEI